jgi:hypothetical protein
MFWGGVRARLKSPPSWPTLPSSTGAAAMEVNEVCGEPKPGVVAVSMFCWENGGIKKNTEKTHTGGREMEGLRGDRQRGEESSMSIGRLFHQKDPRFP